MLSGGFLPAAPSLSRRTFNDWPQCGGFGLTSAGACAFSGNVASVSRLGLFSSGLLQHLLEQSHGFSRGSLNSPFGKHPAWMFSMFLVYQASPAKEEINRKTRPKFLEIAILESRLRKNPFPFLLLPAPCTIKTNQQSCWQYLIERGYI